MLRGVGSGAGFSGTSMCSACSGAREPLQVVVLLNGSTAARLHPFMLGHRETRWEAHVSEILGHFLMFLKAFGDGFLEDLCGRN